MKTAGVDKQGSVALKVEISADLSHQLRDLATIKGVDINRMVREILEDRMEQERPLIRRKQYFEQLKTTLREHRVPQDTIDTLEDNFVF